MKKIFKREDWEEIAKNGGVPHYGYYYPYWLKDGSKNPKFNEDVVSGLILDVKDKKEKGLNFFFNFLDSEIEKGVSICVVPSHIAGTTNTSGIAVLAHRLAASDRIDKVDFLLRTESVGKLATGGSRAYEKHAESICANPQMNISGDVVLLMDDVTTSGNSLIACKDILLQNGASRVAMFALGQTI